MQPNDPRIQRDWNSGRLVPAIVLIGIGALFLLSNLHIIPSMNWFDFWPVILIVIGALKLVDAGGRGHYTGGAILLGVGAAFLANNLGVLPFPVWDLWPLLLIGLGAALLFERIPWHGAAGFDWRSANVSANDVNLAAVFSGGKRKIVTDDFRGGVISAVFGGFELDLRSAAMRTNVAVIKIDAVFGGVEIRIPEAWSASVEGTGVFGGYSDETMHPQITADTKRLIVKGGAIFGGVVVKN